MHRARAEAEDVADIAIGLALDHPVKHFRLPRRQAERSAQALDHRGVRFLAHDHQPFPFGGRLVRRAHQPTAGTTQRQRQRIAPGRAFARRRRQPADQFGRRQRIAAEPEALEQFTRQRGLPDQSPGRRLHCDRGLAMGVEGGSRLPGHARGLQVRGDPHQHLAWPDRLGDVVGTAGLECRDDMFGLSEPGHEYDRDVLGGVVRFQAPCHLKAVHTRHQCVEQNHAGHRLAGTRQGVLAIGRHQHHVAGFVERVVQHGEVFRHVIHDQHDPGRRTIDPVHSFALRPTSAFSASSLNSRRCPRAASTKPA